MYLYELLQIEKGLTAVIGSGGKTSLILKLAEELQRVGTVIFTTTTHILQPENMPCVLSDEEREIRMVLGKHGVACVASVSDSGKLQMPGLGMARLAALADYVLVEADGSKRLPLKAHLPHEPVIPCGSKQVICVVGLSAIGRRIRECAHRPELFASLGDCEQDDLATPEHIGLVLQRECLYDRLFLNQADDEKAVQAARRLASYLQEKVVAGSLQKGSYLCL